MSHDRHTPNNPSDPAPPMTRRIHRKSLGLAFFAMSASLTGCATIFAGRSQELVFAVNPPGTAVCIEGQQVGVTPLVYRTTRRQSYSIWLQKPGYRPAIVAVSKEVNPWIIANFVPLLIFPGPFGLAVDIATGAVHKLEPTSFNFTLSRDTTSSNETPTAPECTTHN